MVDGQLDDDGVTTPFPTNAPGPLPAPSELTVATSLLPSAREYTLLISALKQSAALTGDVGCVARFAAFDEVFRAVVAGERQNKLAQQHAITIANSGLARHRAQRFVGNSPILAKECGEAGHSLLGLGTAIAALDSLVQHAEHALAKARIDDRIFALRAIAPVSDHIWTLLHNDPYFESDVLFSSQIAEQIACVPESTQLPLTTFFSGRDGFRSTRYTISAPLESILGCNTSQWALLTLTHEISHIVIEEVMGLLITSPHNFDAMQEILRSRKNYESAYDNAALLLAFGVLMLVHEPTEGQPEETPDAPKVTAQQLTKAFAEGNKEANEILTHLFDFVYFYRGDPVLYIESIWSSWATIPNIEHRVEDYVYRTLTAVYYLNRRRENGLEVTITQVKSELTKLLKEITKSEHDDRSLKRTRKNGARQRGAKSVDKSDQKYLEIALGLLSDTSSVSRELLKRSTLVKFFRAFLYSDSLARELNHDVSAATGGESNIYGFSSMTFEAEPISNPLRFIETFSKGLKPSASRSAWLLQQLAFGRRKNA